MMNADEQLDYLEAVDELRRLQQVTPRPMHPVAARKMREQEARVDEYTARFLARRNPPAPVLTSSSPT
jgi:hypothetical protein